MPSQPPDAANSMSERGSDSLISEAPSHNTAIGIMPPVPALRPNAVPRVKFGHGVKALKYAFVRVASRFSHRRTL